MDTTLRELLQQAETVHLTTYDGSGRGGTVPVWFWFEENSIYFVTMRDSRKVEKIRRDPRVALHLGEAQDRVFQGEAMPVTNPLEQVRILTLWNDKYEQYWGDTGPDTIRELMEARVLYSVRLDRSSS